MSADKWAEYREHERRMLRDGGYKTEMEVTTSPAFARLRASHDRLLAAADETALLLCWFANNSHVNKVLIELQAAIAAAEEQAP